MQEHKAKSIYESLPMQAALRLYIPHSDGERCIHIPETESFNVPMEPLRLRFNKLIHLINKNKGNKK